MASFRWRMELIFTVKPAGNTCHFCILHQPHLLWQGFYKTLLSVTGVSSAINTSIRYKATMTFPGWLILLIPCEQRFLLAVRKEMGCAHENDNGLCLLILSRREKTIPLFACSNCRRQPAMAGHRDPKNQDTNGHPVYFCLYLEPQRE